MWHPTVAESLRYMMDRYRLNKLKLFGIFLKREVSGNKMVTLFSVFSVALGIALFFSITISTSNAVSKFSNDIEKSTPEFKYQLLPVSGLYMDETVYKILPHEALSVIEIYGKLENSKTVIPIVGVDIFKISNLVSQNTIRQSGLIADFFTRLNSVICSKKTAEEFNLSSEQPVNFILADINYPLSVSIVDTDNYLYDKMLIMDIGNMQEVFNLTGKLSKIYLKEAIPGVDFSKYNAQLVSTENILKNKTELLSSFTYNLKFIGLIGMLAGFFLLYNSMFVSAVRKRKDTGILKSLGASNLDIILYYTFYSVTIGIIGSGAGLFIGYIFSGFTSILTSSTIGTIYNTIIENSNFVKVKDVLYTLIVGVFLTLLSTLVPAFEAVNVKTVDVIKEGSLENRYKFYYKPLFYFGALLIFIGILLNIYEYMYSTSSIPYHSYIGVFMILLGFVFISPFIIFIFVKFLNKYFSKSFKIRGKIVLEFLSGNIYRYASGVVSVFITAALIISMNIMIHSFKTSLTLWIEDNINADIYLKPSSCKTNFCFEPMADNTRNILSEIRTVENVNYFRVFPGKFKNKDVLFGFGDVNVVSKYRKVSFPSVDLNSVAVSEFIQIKFGINPGDRVEIITPKGLGTFIVREVFTSYSTTGGFIIFDRTILNKYWGEDGFNQVSIFLKKGADVQKQKTIIKSALKNDLISITDRDELKTQIFTIFDNTFLVTYGIQMVAFMISLVGVISTIITSIYEKKREISILNFLGATKSDFRSIFSGTSMFIGICGLLLGLVLGSFLSILLIKVINKISFGWSIRISLPLTNIFFIEVFLLITVVLAGFISSNLVRMVDAKKT